VSPMGVAGVDDELAAKGKGAYFVGIILVCNCSCVFLGSMRWCSFFCYHVPVFAIVVLCSIVLGLCGVNEEHGVEIR